MKNNFKKKVLPNGFTILFEKRDIPVVSMAIGVRAGGIHETKEEKGISHFIEHMFYKGTPTRSSRQIAEAIEKNGGELNGFTSEEIVAYWCKMPSKNADIGLDVLIDLVKNPLFDEKELEKEREVIFEELKMYKDNPRLHVFDEAQKCLYGGTMGMSLIGTQDTMNSITREQIVKKFKEIYVPRKMILSVVGNYEFDKLVALCEKNFSGEGEGVKVQEFSLKNEIKEEKREGIDQANLVFAYHSPLAGDSQSDVAQVLMTLIAGGMSSRLFAEIREKRNLAYTISGGAHINKNYSYSFVYAGCRPEKIPEVRSLILEEYRKVAEELGEKELNEIKEQLMGNYQISMEDSQTQMVGLLAEEVHGKAEDFYDFEEKIKAVKLEDVRNMASGVKEGAYSFFSLVPK